MVSAISTSAWAWAVRMVNKDRRAVRSLFFIFYVYYRFFHGFESDAQGGDPEADQNPARYGGVKDHPHAVIQFIGVKAGVAAAAGVHGACHAGDYKYERDHGRKGKDIIDSAEAGALLLVV